MDNNIKSALDKECRKAVEFKFKSKELKAVAPDLNYKNTYEAIKRFMLKNGFRRHPCFDYVSDGVMNYEDLKGVMQSLLSRFPFLRELKINAMNVGEVRDVTYLFHKNADVPTREDKAKSETAAKPKRKRTVER